MWDSPRRPIARFVRDELWLSYFPALLCVLCAPNSASSVLNLVPWFFSSALCLCGKSLFLLFSLPVISLLHYFLPPFLYRLSKSPILKRHCSGGTNSRIQSNR